MDRPADPDELDGPTVPETVMSSDVVVDGSDGVDEEAGDTDATGTDVTESDASPEESDAGLAMIAEDGHAVYDLSEWSSQSRRLLATLLGSTSVVHSWLGTVLEVPAAELERTEELIAEVRATEEVGLDPEAPKLVYEVGGWSPALQSMLADALGDADIAYEWDASGDLVVYEEDEAAVEAIFDGLPDDDESADDGIAAQDLLTALFVAVSDLARRPRDAGAVVGAAAATERLSGLGVPFGFDRRTWEALVGAAESLRSLLDSDRSVSDDEVAEAAAALRDRVRQYV